MDIISAIIMIVIWVVIGGSVKRAKQANPPRRRQESRTPKQTAAQTAEAKTVPVQKPAAAAAGKTADASLREVKARLEKAKGAYTPVTVPESREGEAHGHTVQPSFEPGAHAHEETSLTGFNACPPEAQPEVKKQPAPAAAPAATAPTPAPAPAFAFTQENLLRAIVYSEILSKPRALR